MARSGSKRSRDARRLGARAARQARSRRATALRSLVIFVGTLLALVAAYAVFYESPPMGALSRLTALTSAWTLNLLGQGVAVTGTELSSAQFYLDIIPECTAASTFAIYLAALVAYPAPLSSRMKGLLLGATALFALNTFRIISLYAVGSLAPQHLDFVHLVVWQFALVVITVGIWLRWTRHVAVRPAS